MATLTSSAPGIYSALWSLVQKAAAAQGSSAPAVGALLASAPLADFAAAGASSARKGSYVGAFPFELFGYQPGSYVIVGAIENHEFEWETIGAFSQIERYDITGLASVFTGDSPAQNPAVATNTLQTTYDLFQSVVLGPAMSNRTAPILGTIGPSPYLMLPGHARYSAGPGNLGGGEGGWWGQIEWSLHFEALITPA